MVGKEQELSEGGLIIIIKELFRLLHKILLLKQTLYLKKIE